MSVLNDVDLSLLKVRYQSQEYSLRQLEQALVCTRDLLLVTSLSRDDLAGLTTATGPGMSGARRSAASGAFAKQNKAPARLHLRMNRIRQRTSDNVRVITVSMESPLELLLGVGSALLIAGGIVNRVVAIRERVGESNAKMAGFRAQTAAADAKTAASGVSEKSMQALTEDLEKHGLSSKLLKQPDMASVVHNAAIALGSLDRLEIER